MGKIEQVSHPKGWQAPGQWLLLLVVVVSSLLWVNAQPSLDAVSSDWLNSIGKLAGVIGITLYALNVMLSTRFRVYEKLFGGLNTVYRVHHTNGGLAFIAMLSHPVFLILSRWSYPGILKSYLVPSASGLLTTGYTWGSVALWMTIVLLAITYWAKIPYEWWKRTHYLMGFISVPLLLHIWLVPSDVRTNSLLRGWLLGLLLLALAARAYKFVWLRYIQRGKRYKICEVRKLGSVTEVTAMPDGKAIKYLPGQFVFVTFDSKAIPREEHPFSISTYDANGLIRLSMKNSGDFTAKLGGLHRGDHVYCHGPYGIFGHASYETKHDLVLIAGGIGITPFLSILAYLSTQNKQRKVTLFYSVKQRQEAVYMKELIALKRKLKNLQVVAVETDSSGLLTAEVILKRLGDTKQRRKYLVCGPPAMQNALVAQLSDAGVSNLSIETELFSL